MGKLIVFEGPDGCGKTTQIERVATRLMEMGYKVVRTRQPGGTKIGADIRAILKNPDYFEDLTAVARRLLFTADRVVLNDAIRVSIAENDFVLCDRCEGISNAAYGVTEGCSIADIRTCEDLGSSGTVAIDRAYLFHITPEVAWDRTDHEDLADRHYDRFFEVNEAYGKLIEAAFTRGAVTTFGGTRIPAVVVDAEQPVAELTGNLIASITHL
jgi:dTMP kinase